MRPVVVFVGPSVSRVAAQAILPAYYFPPVSVGDVTRVARSKPFAIGIIDGLFEATPAVWHKEILFAISSGVHVFGASSMGALRAAELAAFGMQGIGHIYSAFASGEYQDDDEVALVHEGADASYRPLSEPMVNIRATLLSATAAGVISPAEQQALADLAKATFYPERGYARLVWDARQRGMDETVLAAFERFAKHHRVDQKRDDALAMLRAIRSCAARGEAPPPPQFALSRTDAWEHLFAWASAQEPILAEPAADLRGATS